MTEPGYQGASTPDPNAPQAPGVPGQYVPPTGASTPPGPAVPPPGYDTADDKTWALIAHFGGAAGALFCGTLAFVAPLVAYLVKKDSPTARQHAVAALNFQIPVTAVGVVLYIISVSAGFSLTAGGAALSLLFFFLRLAVLVFGAVFGIIAGIRANEGQLYKYPISFPIVK